MPLLPTYSDQPYQASQFVFRAGDYTPGVLAKGEFPLDRVIGCKELADCIGIVAWHPEAALVYHMNNVDTRRIAFALINLAKKAKKLPDDFKAECDEMMQFLKDSFCLNTKQNEQAEALIRKLTRNDVYKDIKFNLATCQPRNIVPLLSFFQKVGITEEDIRLDPASSEIYIDRVTGTVSKSCGHTAESQPATASSQPFFFVPPIETPNLPDEAIKQPTP